MQPVWQVDSLACLGLQRFPGTWDFDLRLPVSLPVSLDFRTLILTDWLGGERNQPGKRTLCLLELVAHWAGCSQGTLGRTAVALGRVSEESKSEGRHAQGGLQWYQSSRAIDNQPFGQLVLAALGVGSQCPVDHCGKQPVLNNHAQRLYPGDMVFLFSGGSFPGTSD